MKDNNNVFVSAIFFKFLIGLILPAQLRLQPAQILSAHQNIKGEYLLPLGLSDSHILNNLALE